MNERFCVYMVTNKTHTTLYIGVTNDLQRRIWEHRTKANPRSFASSYSTNRLLWYDEFPTALQAIACEKHLKGLTRAKKDAIIRTFNPRCDDLAADWYE